MDSVITVMQIERMERDHEAMSRLNDYDTSITAATNELGMCRVFLRVVLKKWQLRALPSVSYTVLIQWLEVQRRRSARLQFIRKYEPTITRLKAL